MSLLLATAEAELSTKIRNRIAEGAALWEVAADQIPAWFAAEVSTEEIKAAFGSEHALVAVLGNGKTVVRRVPRH